MHGLHGDVDRLLDRAKELEELGDQIPALELYKSALTRTDKDDPRREEIQSAIAYLQVSTAPAVEPEQLLVWQRFKGWVLARRKARWVVVGVLVLFEIGLFLSRRTILDTKASSAAVNGMPIPAQSSDTPVIELALAPTPLAPFPTGTNSPTVTPTPTATLFPSPTPTALPTVMPEPTPVPGTNPVGGEQGSISPSSNGTSPTVGPTSAPIPSSPPAPTVAPPQPPTPVPPPPGGGSGGSGPGPGSGGNGHGGGNGNGNGGGGGKGKHK